MDKSTRIGEALKQTQIAVDETEQDDIRHHLQTAADHLETVLEPLEQQHEE
jgi:hypothetical protein